LVKDTLKQNKNDQIKNYCIVITGGVATGKSVVASMLRKLGYTVIDADQVAREVVQPGRPALKMIAEAFGQDLINHDGQLNRSKLREIIMRDDTARKKLEGILHPAIQTAFESTVKTQKLGHGKIFFYEAALVFEIGRDHLFKECWATYCSEETQIQRLQQRSHLTRQQCLDIIRAQMPAALKAAKANRQIDTEVGLADLEENIKNLVKVQKP
jgi:dephospho-CoA kinase